jgi:hypothetical protein
MSQNLGMFTKIINSITTKQILPKIVFTNNQFIGSVSQAINAPHKYKIKFSITNGIRINLMTSIILFNLCIMVIYLQYVQFVLSHNFVVNDECDGSC